MSERFDVLGVPGSLRRASYNRSLLRTAIELSPPTLAIETYEIGTLPFFDVDVEAEGDPPPVQAFKERVRQADALLLVTPQYNGAYPGLLKNALDWASRPPRRGVLEGKPVAIMGTGTGSSGTRGAQEALRPVLGRVGAMVLAEPEVIIPRAQTVFDEQGTLRDPPTREQVRQFMAAFAAWLAALRND
jgi:chromate reductase